MPAGQAEAHSVGPGRWPQAGHGGRHKAPREPAEWGWLNRVCASFLTFLFCFSLCIFCGERSDSFTEEGLDLHYWKDCLMLTRCDYCKQVRCWRGWARPRQASWTRRSRRPNHKNVPNRSIFRGNVMGKVLLGSIFLTLLLKCNTYI